MTGDRLLSMVAQRIRQHPANYGTGTYVETVENEAVERDAERLLQSVGYSGMVEMEFKYDVRDGSYKLLDVNPRTWTWNSIGTVAGVDFPAGDVAAGAGRNAVAHACSPGRGLDVLFTRFPRGLSGNIRRQAFCAAPTCVSFSRPMAFAAFALDDPLPSLADWPMTIKRWLAR